MKRLICFVLACVMLFGTAIVPVFGAEKKKYRDPPKEKEIGEKNLIIGQFIIYMPKLTTDNLAVAKETMTDSQRMYYKSEFLNGEWIVMEDVRELHHLMLNDPTKIKPKSHIENFKFIAQIDKDGNLIKFDGYDEFIESLSQEKPDEANEIAGTLFDQLSGAENQTLLNSISNMNAESKSLEDKADEVNALYEKTKDRRLLTVVQQLENEIDKDGKKSSNDGGIEALKEVLESQESLSDDDVSLLEALEAIDKGSTEEMLSDVEKIYEKTKDDRLLTIIQQLENEVSMGGGEIPDDGGIEALKEVLESQESMSNEDASLLEALEAIDKDNTESMLSEIEKIYEINMDKRLLPIIKQLENAVSAEDGGIRVLKEVLKAQESLSDEDKLLLGALEAVDKSNPESMLSGIKKIYDDTKDERLESIIDELKNNVAQKDGGLSEYMDKLAQDVDKGTKAVSLLKKLEGITYDGSDDTAVVENLYEETGEERLKNILDSGNLTEGINLLLDELESEAERGDEASLLLKRLNESKDKSQADILGIIEDLYGETGEEDLKMIANNLRNIVDEPSTTDDAEEIEGKTYNNAIKKFVDKLYGKGDLSDKDRLLITELEKINGVPQAVKEMRLLELQLQQARANGDTNQEQALMAALGMNVYDKEQDMQLIADDLRNQGLDSLAEKAQDESMSQLQLSSDRETANEFVKAAAAAALMLPQDEQDKLTDAELLSAMSEIRGKNDELLSNLIKGGTEAVKVSGEKLASERDTLEKLLKDKEVEIDRLTTNLEDLLSEISGLDTNEGRTKLLTALEALQNAENQAKVIENSIAAKKKEASALKTLADRFAEQIHSEKMAAINDAVSLIYENTAVDYEIDIIELMLIRYVFIEEYKAEKSKNHGDSMESLKLKIEELDYRINGILDMGLLDEKHVNLKYNLRLCEVTGDSSKKETYEKELSQYESFIETKKIERENTKEAAKSLLNKE